MCEAALGEQSINPNGKILILFGEIHKKLCRAAEHWFFVGALGSCLCSERWFFSVALVPGPRGALPNLHWQMIGVVDRKPRFVFPVNLTVLRTVDDPQLFPLLFLSRKLSELERCEHCVHSCAKRCKTVQHVNSPFAQY